MLRVWADGHPTGLLARFGRGASFTYGEAIPDNRAISITMPVRTASWNSDHGLNPVFQMNMPEGRLRERLRLDFSKAIDGFDDLDLLGIVGSQQIGRLRYSAPDADLSREMPLQSIDEILKAEQDNGLYEFLLTKYAQYSGIAGVQPKVLIRDENAASDRTRTVQGATHIVKFWDEFDELAANEFFCLTAAQRAGFRVPDFRLSESGQALVIDRFDLAENGKYLGFEDFCVLNGVGSEDKYTGSYENRLFRRIKDMATENEDRGTAMLIEAFEVMVFNYAVRNGDAHLKNFGVLYRDVSSEIELSPLYDVVTTTPYIPVDTAALTLGGTKRWPKAKPVRELGKVRAQMSDAEISSVFERIANALADTIPEMRRYFRDAGSDIGEKMIGAWDAGIRDSLELSRQAVNIPLPSDAFVEPEPPPEPT